MVGMPLCLSALSQCPNRLVRMRQLLGRNAPTAWSECPTDFNNQTYVYKQLNDAYQFITPKQYFYYFEIFTF